MTSNFNLFMRVKNDYYKYYKRYEISYQNLVG